VRKLVRPRWWLRYNFKINLKYPFSCNVKYNLTVSWFCSLNSLCKYLRKWQQQSSLGFLNFYLNCMNISCLPNELWWRRKFETGERGKGTWDGEIYVLLQSNEIWNLLLSDRKEPDCVWCSVSEVTDWAYLHERINTSISSTVSVIRITVFQTSFCRACLFWEMFLAILHCPARERLKC